MAGIQKEGPADQAGIRAGDIIVELDGTTIANIYDYQFAPGALKVGEPAWAAGSDPRRAARAPAPAARFTKPRLCKRPRLMKTSQLKVG